jgi:uncharacterized protein YdeI (BOF family)
MTRCVLLLGFIGLASGCSDRQSITLGANVEGPVSPIAAVQHTNIDAQVVLRGRMTKKCPTAGCWFVLEDRTGSIKVDTKSAGFVVVDVPLTSSLLVAGRVVTNGNERVIDAAGVRTADAR